MRLAPAEQTALAVSLGVALAACLGPAVYACQSDAECQSAGGICGEAGYCAFPNPDCGSGYAYGKYAANGLEGECTPSGSTTTTSGDTETGDTGEETGTGESSTDSTTEPDTGETGEPECGNDIVEGDEYCDGPVANGMCRFDCQTIICDGNWSDCNDTSEDGCEAQLDLPTSCGSCDDVCDSPVCQGGDCAMLVFATKTAWSAGQIQGLAGANVKCQAEADDHGLSGTYLAWLGVGANTPLTDFSKSDGLYVRPDGATIANSFADVLDAQLDNPIMMTLDLDAPQNSMTCPKSAWTNLTASGQVVASQTCQSFTGSNPGENGRTGQWDATDATWTFGCIDLCSSFHPLFCFQQAP